jgi:hypothetical protein
VYLLRPDLFASKGNEQYISVIVEQAGVQGNFLYSAKPGEVGIYVTIYVV